MAAAQLSNFLPFSDPQLRYLSSATSSSISHPLPSGTPQGVARGLCLGSMADGHATSCLATLKWEPAGPQPGSPAHFWPWPSLLTPGPGPQSSSSSRRRHLSHGSSSVDTLVAASRGSAGPLSSGLRELPFAVGPRDPFSNPIWIRKQAQWCNQKWQLLLANTEPPFVVTLAKVWGLRKGSEA